MAEEDQDAAGGDFLPAVIPSDEVEYLTTGSAPQGGITGLRRLKAHERRLKAAQYRRGGASYREIAEALGYASPSGAYSAVRALLDKEEADARRDLRQHQVARLEHLMSRYWSRAERGDIQALNAVLGIMDRIDRKWNLDDWETLADEDKSEFEAEADSAVFVIEGELPEDYLDEETDSAFAENVTRLIPRPPEVTEEDIEAAKDL